VLFCANVCSVTASCDKSFGRLLANSAMNFAKCEREYKC
jgi:hypothetical protein